MANFYLPSGSPFVKQSTMPHNIPQREYTPGSGNLGLKMGIVKQVHYNRGTVDVALTSGAQGSQGQLVVEAMLPVEFFGNDSSGNYFGSANFPKQGSYVVIGYLGGQLSSPVVLNFYANSLTGYQNISTTTVDTHDDNDSQLNDLLQGKKTVYPSQEFSLVSGNGDYYRTFHGGSFIQIADDPYNYMDDTTYDGTNNGYFNNPKTGAHYKLRGKGQKWLVNHESNIAGDLHRTRLFVNREGSVQLLLYNLLKPTQLLRTELSLDGGLITTRQFDTNVYGDSTQYTQTYFSSDNSYIIRAVQGDSIGSIEVTKDGTLIDGVHIASESALSGLSSKYDAISLKYDALNSTLDELNPDTLKDLPTKVQANTRDVAKANSDISTIKGNVESNTSAISSLSEKVDTNYTNTQGSFNTQGKQIDDINTKLINYDSNVATLNNINSTYAATKQEADDYSLNKSSFLTNSSDTIATINSNITGLANRANKQDDTISTLSSTQTTQGNEIRDLVSDKVSKSVIDKLNANVNFLAQKAGITLPNPDIYA